ncbi:hypothetical protein [Yoonia sp. 208BN28-4]|uniref:hypothetical protein n=1 Tax=Yoonia sp. 208BN28-4 TaxID=3126505 RepID=UPI0030B70F9B
MLAHADPVVAWARAAHAVALEVVKTPGDMRCGGTWRVGVDEVPNAPDGAISGVPLTGPWEGLVPLPRQWHYAQLSVVYPGYPKQDKGESDAAHRFRLRRDAAHVDGLLPEGPDKRRHLREPHRFILGLPLNTATASPLVVWEGSHQIMRQTFAAAYDGIEPADWGDVDVTDIYQAARRSVFDKCVRTQIHVAPGQAVVLHRHLVHGVAPWGDGSAPPEGRIIAYFRPQFETVADWLG